MQRRTVRFGSYLFLTFQRTLASKGTHTERDPKKREQEKERSVYLDLYFELQNSLDSTVLKAIGFP